MSRFALACAHIYTPRALYAPPRACPGSVRARDKRAARARRARAMMPPPPMHALTVRARRACQRGLHVLHAGANARAHGACSASAPARAARIARHRQCTRLRCVLGERTRTTCTAPHATPKACHRQRTRSRCVLGRRAPARAARIARQRQCTRSRCVLGEHTRTTCTAPHAAPKACHRQRTRSQCVLGRRAPARAARIARHRQCTRSQCVLGRRAPAPMHVLHATANAHAHSACSDVARRRQCTYCTPPPMHVLHATANARAHGACSGVARRRGLHVLHATANARAHGACSASVLEPHAQHRTPRRKRARM